MMNNETKIKATHNIFNIIVTIANLALHSDIDDMPTLMEVIHKYANDGLDLSE